MHACSHAHTECASCLPTTCRNPPPDPSPLSSVRLGPGGDFGVPAAGGGGGGFGYDTPANQPAALRQIHSGGSGGLGGSGRVGRNMSGGMGSGGMGAGGMAGGGMAGGGLLAAQLAMGGGGMGSRQAMQNDKRQAMGLPGAPGFRCARECGRGRTGAWHPPTPTSKLASELGVPLPCPQPAPAYDELHDMGAAGSAASSRWQSRNRGCSRKAEQQGRPCEQRHYRE